MKKVQLLLPGLALIAELMIGASAQAQTDIISAKYGFATGAGGSTGFDFGSGVVGSPTVFAGVNSASYWNLANPNAGEGYVTGSQITINSGNLVDEYDVSSGITASLGNDGTTYNGGAPGMGFGSSTGDYALYNTYALGNWNNDPLTLTLNGLTSGDSYTLITYIAQANLSTGSLDSGSIGGQTLYLKSMNSGGAYVSGTATSSSAATSGNYFQFNNITGVSTVTFTEAGSQGSSLFGFQLVQTTAAVPEPGTLWSVALGFLGLAGYQVRRNRLTRS